MSPIWPSALSSEGLGRAPAHLGNRQEQRHEGAAPPPCTALALQTDFPFPLCPGRQEGRRVSTAPGDRGGARPRAGKEDEGGAFHSRTRALGRGLRELRG